MLFYSVAIAPLNAAKSSRFGWLSFLSVAVVSLLPNLATAAEQVQVRYSLFERSLSVPELRDYAHSGTPSPDLAFYIRLLRPEQQQQLRSILQERLSLDSVTLAQFLYSPTGERLLQRLNQVIQAEVETASFPALRSALILAAADREGLTILNVLQRFPGQSVRIDLAAALETFNTIRQFVSQTHSALAAVRSQSQLESANDPPIPAAVVRTLNNRGSLRWHQITLNLKDASPTRIALTGKERTFTAIVYLPRTVPPRPLPVIVISHGLGSDPQAYTYLAEHLASLGFVVAMPEHPGSSTTRLLALLQGSAKDLSEPQEFLDRPLDLKFLLDTLQQRAQSDPQFQRRLNLNQVGLVGQSFGAYTALALAGAEINFSQLQQSCNELDNSLNISLLLQCQALTLRQRVYNFADSRVKGVIAINPIVSGIFGQQGLSRVQVPVMIIASGADTVAPPLLEQIQPFTWLGSRDDLRSAASHRYLVVIENASHFSTIGESAPGSSSMNLPVGLVGPNPPLARSYLTALSTAFMQTYIANQSPFAVFLSPTAMRNLSRQPLPLDLTRRFNADTLAAALQTQPRNPQPQNSSRLESIPAPESAP